MEYKGQFIGPKSIASANYTGDKTSSGVELVKVNYEDESIEYLSSLMFEETISKEKCTETDLRDKRIAPIVQGCLKIMRDWGLKSGETPYMSTVLNQSLDFNQKEAIYELLSAWMPRPNSLDELDYITVDRILLSKAEKLKSKEDVVIGDKKQ